MEFKKTSIGGISYGEASDLDPNFFTTLPKVTNVDFKDKELFAHLSNPNHPNHKGVVDMLFFVAICHTVITEYEDG
jgi:hypothetical protein